VEVHYTLTQDDYIAFSLYAYRKSGVSRPAFLMRWVARPVLFAMSAVVLWQLGEGVTRLLAFFLVFGGIAHLILFPFFYRARVESGVRKFVEKMGTAGVTGDITLILSEETLTEVTSSTRSTARWADMVGIEDAADRVYIYITGISASVIPRSGFESDEDYEAVRAFALRKLADRVRK